MPITLKKRLQGEVIMKLWQKQQLFYDSLLIAISLLFRYPSSIPHNEQKILHHNIRNKLKLSRSLGRNCDTISSVLSVELKTP